MQYQDIVASLVHSTKNRLQLLQPELDTLRHHADSEVQGIGAHLSRQLEEVNQQLVLLLGAYRLEETPLVNTADIYGADLLRSVVEGVNDPRVHLADETAVDGLEFYGDERLLKAVLIDAVHNALRYCRQQVCLSALQLDGWSVIRVLDDGEPESHPEAELAHNAGVGLWLANRVAEAHRNGDRRGSACHRFDDELGSCFEIKLP